MTKLIPNLISWVKSNILTALLGLVVLASVVGGIFIVSSLRQTQQSIEEVDLLFDPEGPFAILTPRRDGNALILNIERTASYDAISYELAYSAQGIDRGVVGNIDTKQKKGEYQQEVLFGTCSKNVCKYDTGVENGTLTLHIKKAGQAYRMITTWHLQKPDVALGLLTSGDNHLVYKIDPKIKDLSIVGYSIINDLSAAPKLPQDWDVVGKVYSLRTPLAKDLPGGQVSIELADKPLMGSKIGYFNESAGNWVQLEATASGSKLIASSPSEGIFTVFTPKSR
ncbi:hypothetical protein HY389_01575 [Candidatus Daviesbacteria bacterium]|nr:hypothetical protein [Candidatus Daviesbacteria bacterium]